MRGLPVETAGFSIKQHLLKSWRLAKSFSFHNPADLSFTAAENYVR